MTVLKYDKLNENALTVVKTTELLFTEFVGTTFDPTMTKGLMESSPNVYKTGSTFFLDYSNTSNPTDLKLLKRFFTKLGIGNTFNISGGTYYDEVSQKQYNFQGTYLLAGYTGYYNNFLNLTGVCYSTSLIDGVYKNYNWKTNLNFSSYPGLTAQYFVSHFNDESPYNLSFFGMYGKDFNSEEYLEVLGSTFNTDRYLVQSFIKLNDGKEIVIISPSNSIVSENMQFENKTINLLMRGVPDLNTLSQNKYVNGIIKKIDSNQKIIEIFIDQNLHQKFCRSNADGLHYYDWHSIYSSKNFKNVMSPNSYDKLSVSMDYFSSAKIARYTRTSPTGTIFTQESVLGLFVDNVLASTKKYDGTTYAGMPSIRIDLSHSSLLNYTVLPFYDESCSVLLNDFYYINGVPGFEGCSFIFLKNINSPKSFYLKFEGENIFKLLVTI